VLSTKQLLGWDREQILATIRQEGKAFRAQLDSEDARRAMSAFFKR
jgi:D-serine deaminase-like pyridoxal phosphate-dependent protein